MIARTMAEKATDTDTGIGSKKRNVASGPRLTEYTASDIREMQDRLLHLTNRLREVAQEMDRHNASVIKVDAYKQFERSLAEMRKFVTNVDRGMSRWHAEHSSQRRRGQ